MDVGPRNDASRPEEARNAIKAWTLGDTLLEFYRYAPGPAGKLPKHTHEEYQLGLSLNFPGEYVYRGARHTVPAGSLSVIHPDEVHSARDPENREVSSVFLMMYVDPSTFQSVVDEVTGRRTGLPYFESPIIVDKNLSRTFAGLWEAPESATVLEKDSRLLLVLTEFARRHADTRSFWRTQVRERAAVKRVREYLEDNYAESISLGELARISNLSPYYLNRVFSEEVGVPPHRYQLQVRLFRAKNLLARGESITRTVNETGFADQSHFSRHFKRFVGVTPGRYRPENRKNVQDNNGRAPYPIGWSAR
ncbi:MAG: helix-turn-helix domain-containing protein [Rubrobacteraceae bacterium]